MIRKAVSRPQTPVAQTKPEEVKDKPVITSPDPEPKVNDADPSVKEEPAALVKEDKSRQKTLLKIAKSKLGCRYSYAGKGPNTFDCSGFTGYVFSQIGIKLGASSRDQFLQGNPIAEGEPLRPGDLVFWNGRSIGNTVGHVGIVVDYDRISGSFTFIHAAVSTGVEIQKSTEEYYARRYMGARRILDDIPSNTPEYPDSLTEDIAKGNTEKTEVSSQAEPVYHTIKSGDTLSAIAARYHTTVSKICSLNGINSKTILKIGRKLRVK